MGRTEWGLRYEPTRISFILNYIFSFGIILFLVTFLPFIDLSSFLHRVFLSLLLVSLVYLLVEPEIQKYSKEYYITKDEVAVIERFPRKSSVHISYNDINSVSCKSGILGRILSFGDVLIEGKTARIVMKNVRDPLEIKKVVEYKVEELRKEEAFEERKEEKIEEKIKKFEERRGFLKKFRFWK